MSAEPIASPASAKAAFTPIGTDDITLELQPGT